MELAQGGGVDTTPVYLVVIEGDFVGYGAHLPLGQPYPRGSVLTLMIDRATGDTLDWGIGGRAYDIARLGSVLDVPM